MKIPAILMIVLALSACTTTIDPEQNNPIKQVFSSSEIKYFSTDEELQEYLEENQQTNNNYYARGGTAMFADMAMETMAVAESAPAKGGVVDFDGADEYSGTNVQIENVDEADIVKSDGKYLYILAGEAFTIVDAYPAQRADVVSETSIAGTPQNLFLDDNTVVIFTRVNEQRTYWPEYSIVPVPRYTQSTQARIYDVSDRTDPELIETISISGNYNQARMIDGEVYVITNEYPEYEGPIVITPRVASSSLVIEPRIGYFDNPENNYQYTTITTFDSDGGDLEAETLLTGYTNTVFMSTDALYIAYQKNMPWRSAEREQFHEVVLPALPRGLRMELETTDDWNDMAEKLESYVNALDDDGKEEFYEAIDDALSDYERKRAEERQKTIIQKIGLDLRHEASGEVSGTLLNQFSLDEHKGLLRVATTFDTWTRNERIQYNNVYVLDEDLDLVGELEGIAEDERIYSTRFMGDRLYMVTFRQVDPFFVIDLSNPNKPEILGELKIPGWSSYLHPYDENHIIGIGKQTKENEWGGVSTQGVKLSLFDVSDVANPKEVDTYEIGGSGSDSEVLRDHKAFLFDKDRELLVLPVREVNGNYRNVWQGAYVFRVTEDGFEQRKRIAHYEGTQERYWSWWGSTSAVKRALYMDDVLYTVSLEQVRMHDLETMESINSVKLPYEAPSYGYPEPFVRSGVAVAEESFEDIDWEPSQNE